MQLIQIEDHGVVTMVTVIHTVPIRWRMNHGAGQQKVLDMMVTGFIAKVLEIATKHGNAEEFAAKTSKSDLNSLGTRNERKLNGAVPY